MIIVNVYGGLGNQLFQYAAGRQLAEKHGTELKLDIENYQRTTNRRYSLQHFYIKATLCTAADKKLINGQTVWQKFLYKTGLAASRIYTEQGLGFDRALLQSPDNTYLDGYWQSEKYFKAIEKTIRAECRVKEVLAGKNKILADKLSTVNAVSLHVRRGDFVSNKETHAYHSVCGIEYYREAVQSMAAMVTDPYFFVFSDDMEWTRAHVSTGDYPVEYIDHNAGVDYEDLRLMYLCKHHIIANSSFSWWGAWLNEYAAKKVIAPKQWFAAPVVNPDIIPGGWLTL